jgi:hypothetical protein
LRPQSWSGAFNALGANQTDMQASGSPAAVSPCFKDDFTCQRANRNNG